MLFRSFNAVWDSLKEEDAPRSLNILLFGPPGTGKTMAAQVITNQLHMQLFKVQLSQIVSKYIGETEKNLRDALTSADRFTFFRMAAGEIANDLGMIAAVATALAVLSATLDIALDAFRRELLKDEELGLGNAVHVNAYKVAGLIPGSLSILAALCP